MAENILTATDSNFEAEVLRSNTPVLVEFWAEWCESCGTLAQTVEALATDFNGKLKVAKLNVDENPAVSERYGIHGIPTLRVFKDGQLKDQIAGTSPRDSIEKVLEKHLNNY